MHDLTPILDQVRTFLTQHVPAELMARTVLVPLALLLAGIGISVLGAKLARPAMTAAFSLLGAYAGVVFAGEAGYPAPLGGLVGAGMSATIAFLTFRLWVGVATAVVLSAVGLGAFSYQRVAPHLAEFDGRMAWTPAATTAEFAVPTPAEQQAYLDRDPREWIREFWSFVASKDASVPQNSRLLGIAAFAGGLFLGVIAVRWMLILCTSALGTGLVVTSLATLFAQFLGGSYQTLQNRPGVIGMAVGAFLVTSLIIQTLLTRKGPHRRVEPA